MDMPIEVLERLNTVPKAIASPEMGLAKLRHKSQELRKRRWTEISEVEAEYSGLKCDRNKYLSSNIAMSKLKLITSFIDNGEIAPSDHGFTNDEISLYRGLEEFAKYDELTDDRILEFVRIGVDGNEGIFTSARIAAERRYDQIESVISSTIDNPDLEFAFRRKYRKRINKIALAASEYLSGHVEEGSKISAQKAKLMESSYVGLVSSRLHEPQADFKWHINISDNMSHIVRELSKTRHVSADDAKRSIPNCLEVRAVIESRKVLRRKKLFILEVKVLSDYQRFFKYGADSGPLSVSEITPYITSDLVTDSGCSHVLILASITGWSDDATSYLKDDRIVMHNGCVILVDLQSDAVHYAPSADRALEFSPLRLHQVLYYIIPQGMRDSL